MKFWNPGLAWASGLATLALLLTAAAPAAARVAPTPASAGSGPSYEEIDAYVAGQLKALNIPGAALVIVDGDRLAHFRGFGVTGPGGATPTAQTPYFIGSLTKSITALAVMQLVEAGKVELDAPVQRYLPWFSLADPELAAGITVRHLLNQTSGLEQVPGMINLADFDPASNADERQARALANFRPSRPAGAEFEYSNLNFNLLGLVVEAASSESYADYVRGHIFAPLDMRHSYASKEEARADGLAVGHQQWFGQPIPVPDLPVPVGSLASGQLMASAEDLGHYLIGQLNGGRYGEAQVLSPAGMDEMHRPAVPVLAFGNDMGDYAMGWFVIEKDGRPLIFHDGETADGFAYTALLPEKKQAVALLINTNQQIYNYAMWALAEDVAGWLASGRVPRANAWPILPWVLPLTLLLPLGQIIGAVAEWKRIRAWRAGRRPGKLRLWLGHILLPAFFELLLIAVPVGMLLSGMYAFLFLFLGDLVLVFTVSGVIALAWLIVRIILIFRTIRIKPGKVGENHIQSNYSITH